MGLLNKIFGRQEKVSEGVHYHLGPYKKRDDIKVDDFRLHPVWVAAKGGEGFGFDNATPRPVLGVKRVTEAMLKQFTNIYVLIRFTESGHWGWACMSEVESLDNVVVWTLYDKEDARKVFAGQDNISIQVVPQVADGHQQDYIYSPETGKAMLKS